LGSANPIVWSLSFGERMSSEPMPASLDSSPFADTAEFYDRFRAPYAEAAIDFIIERFNLSDSALWIWDAGQARSPSRLRPPSPKLSPSIPMRP
jgi:hypothetical protein